MENGDAFWEWLKSRPDAEEDPVVRKYIKKLGESFVPPSQHKKLKVVRQKTVDWDAELKKLPRRLVV